MWINFDEKWFYGCVPRMAKRCEGLGLKMTNKLAVHKSHITKVMVLAVTGYAFVDNVENGGVGLKIGLYRAQAARVASRVVREGRRDPETGALKYDGRVLRRAGDVYMVDCNITGSNSGTSRAPKFALLDVFRDHIFRDVSDCVRPGGDFDGYTPVYQGDHASPHEDRAFLDWVTKACADTGSHWMPQAPRHPHLNVLDLAVFPAMSRRHSELIAGHSQAVVGADVIWKCAKRVWTNLPSAKIARAHVLAYRIAKKVVRFKGGNEFLGGKPDLHSRVRQDFDDTDDGIRRSDGHRAPPPPCLL